MKRKRKRERRNVKRERNGQAVRTSAKQDDDATREAAVLARCKAMGWLPRIVNGSPNWKPTEEQRVLARQPHMAFEFGRLLQRRGFDPDLYSAGVWLIGSVVQWRKLMGLPSFHAKTAGLEILPDRFETETVGGAGFDPRTDDEKLRAAHARYRMAYDWLADAGLDVRNETVRCVVYEERPNSPDLVMQGLLALSKKLRG